MSIFRKGLQNASYLAFGNVVSHALSLVGFIFIARALGAENLGIYSIVGAFVDAFSLLLLPGLRKVVVREGSKDLAKMDAAINQTIGVRYLLIALGIAACVGLCWFMPYVPSTKIYISLYSLMLIHTGMRTYLDTIFEASERMHIAALLTVANRIVFVSLALAVLYTGHGLMSLFVVSLVVHLGTVGVAMLLARRIVPFKLIAPVRFDGHLMRPAFVFSLISFLGFLSMRIDILMLSLLATPAEAGLYAIAGRIADQGIMLRNVTATAFFPITVKVLQQQSLKTWFLVKYSLLFLGVMTVVAWMVSIISEPLIAIVFDDRFKGAGPILAALIFYIGVAWARLPFTSVLQATHNEGVSVWPSAVTALMNIPLNLVLYRQYGVVGIAYSTIIVNMAGTIVISIIGCRILKKQGHLV
ncbi:MAG: oligosaccharide flippase family protein [Verrucomicrobia bacterium]|nr:oligosaccharide flippase family protein [Verrucomicrobiota bacterium]